MKRFMMLFCFGVSSPPSKAIGTVSWHLRAIDQLWETAPAAVELYIGHVSLDTDKSLLVAYAAMRNYATSKQRFKT